ncbi:MAG: LD-carboxypeptidase, partial [Chthonomonadaceae bacterium]|nr:LD-carboxypeptidase [Chthonomonadaceae bacterium]
MTKPRALRPGSSIRIVSPASPVKPDGVAKGVALLEAQGYKVSFGRHAFDSDGYLAGHDESRLADIRDAYADETVDAVACSRGGYGCSRLLNRLDLDAMAASGKMFVGFSDLTVLHSALNRRGIVTFYAPMLLTFSVDREPWVVTSFLNLLKGEDSLTVDHPKGETLIGGT